jgi:hypothetical protein
VHDGRFATRQHPFEVAGQEGLERLLVLPLRMLGRQRFDAVEAKDQLEIHRLLDPQRAVVVEGGDAVGGWDKLRSAFAGHIGRELQSGGERFAALVQCLVRIAQEPRDALKPSGGEARGRILAAVLA